MAGSGHLFVFLDEGGNFDFSINGTKYVTLTTVSQQRPFSWFPELADLRYDYLESGLDIERFHAAEDRQAVRDSVFEIITKHLDSLRVDSLIVEKRKTSPALQPIEAFYPRMLGYLFDTSWKMKCGRVIHRLSSSPIPCLTGRSVSPFERPSSRQWRRWHRLEWFIKSSTKHLNPALAYRSSTTAIGRSTGNGLKTMIEATPESGWPSKASSTSSLKVQRTTIELQ